MEKALRYNSGKLRWSLVHWKSLIPLVQVLTWACTDKKPAYPPDNWKKGLDKKEILNSMMRHLTALMDGENLDEESKLRHIGHIQCNAMFYAYEEDREVVITANETAPDDTYSVIGWNEQQIGTHYKVVFSFQESESLPHPLGQKGPDRFKYKRTLKDQSGIIGTNERWIFGIPSACLNDLLEYWNKQQPDKWQYSR